MKKRSAEKVMAGILGAVMILSQVPYAFAEKEEDILHYDFESEITAGENYGSVIENGYAYFDGKDDYIQMPDNLISGEEKVTFLLNVRPEIGAVHQFTFTLGTGDSNYLFLNTNNPGGRLRFAMTTSGHQNEEELTSGGIEQGKWQSVAVVLDGKTKKLYVDGSVVSETTGVLSPSSLGDTNRNYLAKSQYATDSYFKGYIEDFRIVRGAMTTDEIKLVAEEHRLAAELSDVYIVSRKVDFDSFVLTENIELPTELDGINIEWRSSDEEKLSSSGVITRSEFDYDVDLTATFSDDNNNVVERVYKFTVLHEYTDTELAKMDIEALHLVGNLSNLKEDLYLPKTGVHGSELIWISENEDIITNDGKIKRLPVGEGSRTTKLYLNANYNGKTVTKEYEVTVMEEDFAYLFAYFTGNNANQEKVYYGLSRDGYNFNAINNGNPVLESTKGHKGVRDPFIMQGQNGRYYLLLTDMRSSEGWRSQSSIIIFESEDLINWDDGTIIDFNQFGWYSTAWAPQAIWDPEFYDEETGEYGAYMIYLALCTGGDPQMYKVYSKDMKTLITKPEILYKRADNKGDIDSDIIYKDGLYYMYVKDESDGGVYVVTSEHAGGPYSERINALPAKDRWGNNVAIEGSAIYKIMNTNKYNLVYDAYMSNFFVMTETEDLVNFTQLARSDYSFNFTPRHGYVIPISKAEVDKLEEKYGKSVAERIEARNNPILYYDFESEKDKSGNFNDAQFAQSAQIANGISGGLGLKLDGTSESYVTIPKEVTEGLEDYTVSAWIKPDTNEITQRVFDFGTDNQRYMFLTPFYSGGVLRGAITAGSYDYEKGISVECEIETKRWTHLVMMQEGDVMRIYIDGILAGEADNVKLDPYEIAYEIPYCYIGKSMWSGDKYFKGEIDEFRIYDRALSEEEVKELYAMELTIALNISEQDGVYTIEFAKDTCDIDAFDAVLCQYEGDILAKAEILKVDFDENGIFSAQKDKVSDEIRVLMFEDITSLKPLK